MNMHTSKIFFWSIIISVALVIYGLSNSLIGPGLGTAVIFIIILALVLKYSMSYLSVSKFKSNLNKDIEQLRQRRKNNQ